MYLFMVNVCDDCYSFLHKKKLPIHSFENHLYIGKMPEELKDLTIVEECCIARAWILMNLIKLDDKGATGIRGNFITFPQNPNKILQILPQIPSSTEIQIIFTLKKNLWQLIWKKFYVLEVVKLKKVCFGLNITTNFIKI